MSERAKRYWHLAERYGYHYAENQYGGFTRYYTREQAIAAIERDISLHGDEWAPNTIPTSNPD